MNRAPIVVIAIACVACKPKADCDGTMSAAMQRVAKTEFKEVLAGQRTRFDEYCSGLRFTIMDRCRTDRWPPETIECFTSSSKQCERARRREARRFRGKRAR